MTTESENNEKAQAIVKQIEYYFGDINLPRDKFLLAETKLNEGWVALTTMLKFNRLAQISKDVDEIAGALTNSSLMEVSEDGKSIRRTPQVELPENTLEYWLEVKRRTVYVRGFPLDSTMDELLKFMSQQGSIENIIMRKTIAGSPRLFKGSIFATFKTKEEAKSFVDGPTLKYRDDVELFKQMQEDYWAEKTRKNKEKKEMEKKLKQKKNIQVVKEEELSVTQAHFVKGSVLKVNGITLSAPNWSDLRTFFGQFGDVAYVEMGEGEIFVRFHEENSAKAAWDKALEKCNGKVVFKAKNKKNEQEFELSASALEGEEEDKFWVNFNKKKMECAKTGGRRNKKGDNGKKKGRQSVKRSLGDVSDGPISKKIIFKDSDDEDKSTEESAPNGQATVAKVKTEVTAEEAVENTA